MKAVTVVEMELKGGRSEVTVLAHFMLVSVTQERVSFHEHLVGKPKSDVPT